MPRPSSPPSAKASTRCPSLAQSSLKPSCTGTTNTPQNKGEHPSYQPRRHQRRHIRNSAFTLNAPEPCNAIHTRIEQPAPNREPDLRPGSDKHSRKRRHGQTSATPANSRSTRVVLRAQERTRTRFTCPKTKTPGTPKSRPAQRRSRNQRQHRPDTNPRQHHWPEARIQKPGSRDQKQKRHAPRVQSLAWPGGGRDRTDDLLLAKQALSQLSYAPAVTRNPSGHRPGCLPANAHKHPGHWHLNHGPGRI